MKDYQQVIKKNSFLDLYSQAMNGLIFTMNKSIRVIGIISLLTAFVSLTILLVSVALKIFIPDVAPKGITLLICLVTLFFSITSCLLNLVLEYALSIHSQVRGNVEVRIKDKKNF